MSQAAKSLFCARQASRSIPERSRGVSSDEGDGWVCAGGNSVGSQNGSGEAVGSFGSDVARTSWGAAYPCFCTKEELQERRDAAAAKGEQWKYDKHCLHIPKEEALRRMKSGEPFVIRQNIPLTGTASFDDALYGHVEAPCDTLDDNVLIKQDGLPTYNFANVIDDHLMGITHVMRGTEYLSSTPKYNLLYEAFGWEKPTYIHLSPVMKDASRKLSKRYGDPSFEDLLSQGYVKDAIINFIALLGWCPDVKKYGDKEFFTKEELIEAFDLSGLSKSPAIFNTEKLDWFNHEYITRMSLDEYLELATPWFDKVLAAVLL